MSVGSGDDLGDMCVDLLQQFASDPRVSKLRKRDKH